MKKRMLWIGIAVLAVLGLMVAVRKQPAAAPVGGDTLGTERAASTLATTATPAPASAPTNQNPPKATAKPKASITPSDAMPENVMLDLSSLFARSHELILNEFLKEPPDFNQYYVVAKWSCGSGCELAGVIDKRNGKAYVAPADNIKSKTPGPDFKAYTLESNLYHTINDQLIDTYSFDGAHFTLINEESF